jgi:3-hydroxyisobutyrate dehydrogenase
MPENAVVAVLGTGIMGAAMARNLLAAGMEVRVWNRTREKADPLARDGAAVGTSPAEATEGAEFMVTMLSDTAAVEDAVGEGALSALGEGGVDPDEYARDGGERASGEDGVPARRRLRRRARPRDQGAG